MILALMAAMAALMSVSRTMSCQENIAQVSTHRRKHAGGVQESPRHYGTVLGRGWRRTLTTLRGPFGFAVRDMCLTTNLAGCTPMNRRDMDAGCMWAPESCSTPKPARGQTRGVRQPLNMPHIAAKASPHLGLRSTELLDSFEKSAHRETAE